MKDLKIKENGKNNFNICGVGPACPNVKKEGSDVSITDDHGGKVKISLEEFEKMKEIKFE